MTRMLQACDSGNVIGRGFVATVDLRQIPNCPNPIRTADDLPLKVGDKILLDTGEIGRYEITHIEHTRTLVSGYILPFVGLNLTAVEPTLLKLQLWTTNDAGDAEECLGEVEVTDDQWAYAQSAAGDAYELITDLAAEISGNTE